MELNNILQKKFKRKNFVVTLAVTAAGYMAARSTIYKLFAKRQDKSSAAAGNIKIRINSSAVSRSKIQAGQTKIGDTNV